MKDLVIFVIVLVTCFSLKAQNQINGRVLELTNDGEKIPVFGANVYWEETMVGTTTDVDGNYFIDEAISFPATLSVSYVGYTFDSKEIINNSYIFYLRSSVNLEEVEVIGSQNTTKTSLIEPLNMQILSTGEIQKAACCNLSECFETNNTIDVSYSDAISGLKKIQMLGLDGNYVQITSELLPLIRGLQRSYGLTYVPGSWIESIQIIKGTGSVVNGFESLTGQINVEFFKFDEDTDKFKWNIFVNHSGKLENNLILTKKNGNWRSNLFTHFSYFDREVDHHGYHHDHTDHTDHKGDNFLDMPKFKQLSILNRWKYFGSDKYMFQINLRGTIEDRKAGQIINASKVNNPYISNIKNQLVQLYTKAGKIINANRSIGVQTSITYHNQYARFGNNVYEGENESISMNFIYQNQVNENSLFKYGSSFFADRFTEGFSGNIEQPFDARKRLDLVPGLFTEYQFDNQRLNIVTGIRTDYYNIVDKIYYTPRINMKYNPGDRTSVRISSGKAFRISNSLADNMQYLSSSRHVIIGDDLKPEVGWNHGFNFSYCFYLLNKEGTLNIDLYRTVFENQIIVDIEDQDRLIFSNLNGNSFANVIQFDLEYSIIRDLNMRLSYKRNNSVATFNGVERVLPLLPSERALVNFAYENIFDKWFFDITANYIGKSRVPENIIDDQSFSPSFILLNSQITYSWKGNDIYTGVENITSYTQPNPIIDSENPFGSNFDASLIWAPVMGRTVYLGVRYNIN